MKKVKVTKVTKKQVGKKPKTAVIVKTKKY